MRAEPTEKRGKMPARNVAAASRSMTAVAFVLALVPGAQAQDVRIAAPSPAGEQTERPLTPDESALLGRALLFDPAGVSGNAPAKALRRLSLNKPAALAVNRSDKPDGSATVAVKKPLTADLGSTALDGGVGADVNITAPPPSVYEPGRPLPGTASSDTGSGAAWASVGMRNLASVDARVDPASDQGKLAGTLRHSLPVGASLSVTLQDSYSVTQSLSASLMPPTAASPITAAPGPSEVFGNQRSVKLDVKSTGTSFGAGFATASNDPVAHRTLSAEQKIYGPLHVTGTVTDLGQPSENRSISAGLKLDW